jgi:hypothetical protein
MGRPMDALFSDRLRALKAALAAAAFVLLCRYAHQAISRNQADLERVPAYFDALRGREVPIITRQVTAADAGSLEIATGSGPLRVQGQTSPPAAPGDIVSGFGEVVGPRQIRPRLLRLHPGYAWKRALNYAVSTLTLGLFVLWTVRRFGLRFPRSLLRSRH